MTEETENKLASDPQRTKEPIGHSFRSLKELIDHISGKSGLTLPQEDARLMESHIFPFLAIVGQTEMKLALLLGLINPLVGGVLLIGPRGTAKTTAVRSLVDLLPMVDRSICHYGCRAEDVEAGGIDAICPECARKFALGEPLSALDRMRVVELPLNAALEDVIGGLDERTPMTGERARIHHGILAQTDQNILYLDEVNLLANDIVDAILDAASQGTYHVRRGPLSASRRARFFLVGSMNPEEGNLRSQIMDRFGLRILVRGLSNVDDRFDAYTRVQAYRTNPYLFSASYDEFTNAAAEEVQAARSRLASVTIPKSSAKPAIKIIKKLGIDSMRAELTWFEAARSYTAADNRKKVTIDDMIAVAPMALRLRRSQFMKNYCREQDIEEAEIQQAIEKL
jgi:magnesium chelatase subunit I